MIPVIRLPTAVSIKSGRNKADPELYPIQEETHRKRKTGIRKQTNPGS
jgi:hypothetical protein